MAETTIDKFKVQRWLEAEHSLKVAKAKELELRIEICNDILSGTIRGTVHRVVDNIDLAATAKLNATLDQERLSSIYPDLTPLEKESVKYKASLVAAKYKEVPDDAKLQECITMKPGTPSLKAKPIT